MKAYIRSASSISPQESFGNDASYENTFSYAGSRLVCREPDYKNLLDPKLIRRMSRIIRMGAAAALDCLHQANTSSPDAIITGTAYGCLEDTGVFLGKLVENREEMLTPTAFIQSTHNTVGAQIALLLKCTAYNNTFVHRGFSFESALLDGLAMLQAGEAETALVGGVDEVTEISHSILSRFGLYRNESHSAQLLETPSEGTMNGEGAAFFLLAKEPSTRDCARLEALQTMYKPASAADVESALLGFLKMESLKLSELDLVFLGKNGDSQNDEIFHHLQRSLYTGIPASGFKHLCGDYPTSSAFALWMAANTLRNGVVPFVNPSVELKKKPKKILVHNNDSNDHHSFYLLSAC